MKNNAFFNWSGGKDSAFALHQIIESEEFDIQALLTNISREHQRISMHGVPKNLLLQQIELLKLDAPLEIIELWETMSMEDYSSLMQNKMQDFNSKGINTAIYGDIFLEDLKKYRETKLAAVGITANFPLWGRNTRDLLEEFINTGFKAVVVAANAQLLDQSFLGRNLDKAFLADLPKGVDPCGENGEFHSFVYDGPIFQKAVDFELGEVVLKEYETNGDWDSRFWFQELLAK